jgi:hypothetical protein
MEDRKDFIKEVRKAWHNEIYDRSDDIDPDADYDWKSLAIGFFLGKGLTADEAKDLVYRVKL